jgi:CheY-like chemotaxis protein
MADIERPQSLLIADSDPIVRHSLAEYLRDCGYRVQEATNFEEAVTLLERPDGGELPSAVLSDVDLAGGNGFALRMWARQHRPNVKVILAGNLAMAAKAAGDLCEDGPHLSRPYDPQLVLERIRRNLGSRIR